MFGDFKYYNKILKFLFAAMLTLVAGLASCLGALKQAVVSIKFKISNVTRFYTLKLQ